MLALHKIRTSYSFILFLLPDSHLLLNVALYGPLYDFISPESIFLPPYRCRSRKTTPAAATTNEYALSVCLPSDPPKPHPIAAVVGFAFL